MTQASDSNVAPQQQLNYLENLSQLALSLFHLHWHLMTTAYSPGLGLAGAHFASVSSEMELQEKILATKASVWQLLPSAYAVSPAINPIITVIQQHALFITFKLDFFISKKCN